MPSTARNPTAGGSLLDAYEPTLSITPPPDFRRDGIASGSASAFFSTPTGLTLTRQASGRGSDGRGQVLFLDCTSRPQRP